MAPFCTSVVHELGLDQMLHVADWFGLFPVCFISMFSVSTGGPPFLVGVCLSGLMLWFALLLFFSHRASVCDQLQHPRHYFGNMPVTPKYCRSHLGSVIQSILNNPNRRPRGHKSPNQKSKHPPGVHTQSIHLWVAELGENLALNAYIVLLDSSHAICAWSLAPVDVFPYVV